MNLDGDADRRQVRLDDLRGQDPLLGIERAQGERQPGDAGLVQQSLGPGRVVGIAGLQAPADQAGANDAEGGLCRPGVGALDDGVLVDGMLDRLTHLDVLQLGMLRVEAHPHVLQGAGDAEGTVRRQLFLIARIGVRGDLGAVQLARLEGQRAGLVFGHEDAVDVLVGRLRPGPVRIGPELHELRLLVLVDVGPAGRRDVHRILAAGRLDGLLAEDDAGPGGQRRHRERREGLVEDDGAVVLVLDVDALVGDVVAAPLALGHAVVGIGDIIRRHFAVVTRPHQALLQGEVQGRRARHLEALDVGGRNPARLPIDDAVMHQGRHDAPIDVVRRVAADVVAGIEALHLAIETDRQGVARSRVGDARENAAQPGHPGEGGGLQEMSA